jgi:hypothetical protein
MRRLILAVELGIGRGKSGVVEIVARARSEPRLQRDDRLLVAAD